MTTTLELPTRTLDTLASDASAVIGTLWPGDITEHTDVTATLDAYLTKRNEAFSGDVWGGVVRSVVHDSVAVILAGAREYHTDPIGSTKAYESGIIAGVYMADALPSAIRPDTSKDPLLQTHAIIHDHYEELGDFGFAARISNFREHPKIILFDRAISITHAFAAHAGMMLVLRSVSLEKPADTLVPVTGS